MAILVAIDIIVLSVVTLIDATQLKTEERLIQREVLPYSRKVWQIDSFQAFGKRKCGELIDQPIDY